MDVTYFRPRRPGPESAIENAEASRIPQLFPTLKFPSWTAGSLPIGAGMPDLVVVACEPEVFALAEVTIPAVHEVLTNNARKAGIRSTDSFIDYFLM